MKTKSKILEISNFPPSFNTVDIVLIFSVLPLKVSWISDTCCQVYFTTSSDLEQALDNLLQTSGNTAIGDNDIDHFDSIVYNTNSNNDDTNVDATDSSRTRPFLINNSNTSSGIRVSKRGYYYFVGCDVDYSSLKKTRIDLNTCIVKPFQESSPPDTKPRPTTSDSVARRLIAGALGVRPLKKSIDELEKDKQKFNAVRSSRRNQ